MGQSAEAAPLLLLVFSRCRKKQPMDKNANVLEWKIGRSLAVTEPKSALCWEGRRLNPVLLLVFKDGPLTVYENWTGCPPPN